MHNEKKKEGSLLIFDALPNNKKIDIPKVLTVDAGIINVFTVNINPVPPSSLN